MFHGLWLEGAGGPEPDRINAAGKSQRSFPSFHFNKNIESKKGNKNLSIVDNYSFPHFTELSVHVSPLQFSEVGKRVIRYLLEHNPALVHNTTVVGK